MKPIQEASLFLIVIILISFLFNYFVSAESFYPDKIIKGIQIYINKILHLYNQSKQDTNKLFALNNISSAYSLANSIKYVMSNESIKQYYNIDINSLIYEIQQYKNEVISDINHLCPNIN
jgi:hypothetical protein